MLLALRKLLNLVSFFFIVLGAIACGIWGFFQVEILPTLMGENLSKIFYYAIGVSGLYGVHLFLEYSKIQLKPAKESLLSEGQVHKERSQED